MPDNGDKKKAFPIRILELLAKTDWRSILLILTAAGGACGAVGNFVKDLIQDARSERVQEGAYELMADRMNELFERVEALEGNAGIEAAEEPADGGSPTSVATGGGPKAEKDAAGAYNSDEPEPAPEAAPEPRRGPAHYGRARLPDFDMVQRAALAPGLMDKIMDDGMINGEEGEM